MQQMKRLRELAQLFFKMVREEGFASTVRRLTGFLRRRLRSKKGRFVPTRAVLERQRKHHDEVAKVYGRPAATYIAWVIAAMAMVFTIMRSFAG